MIFEVDNTTKQLIDELQESIRETISDLESGQSDIKELIENIKLNCDSLATSNQAETISADLSITKKELRKLATVEQLEQIQALFEKLDFATVNLNNKLDKLASDAASALKVSESNKAVLAAITAYLCMPGYKRFFKGMEVVENETAE